ncbi:MAG: D-amino acid aminotransferase [Chromatiaceae bacterium]|nr:MAG: D-amino acid aminotransferase [Chromatiaceae bacterium]
MNEVFLNGVFVPPQQALVPVLDRGFLFGDGVYEVIPAYAGRPLRVRQHLQRLENSLHGIGMEPPLAPAAWQTVFTRLLAGGAADHHAPASPAAIPDQSIYVQVTRGAAPVRDHRFPTGVAPTLLALVKPLPPRDPVIAEEGVSAILREDIRWHRCDIKAVSLLAAVLLRQEAAASGAEEALLVRDGLVVEGSTSNLFMVRDGQLVTPPKGPALLPGITRDLVLELAAGAGIPCAERDLPVGALASADELWITSSTREVVPVTRLDGVAVGSGRPGPLWQRMDALYQAAKRAPEAP